MPSDSISRSQLILRIPVENVNADLILHDGERSEVMLFVPAGEDISQLLADDGKLFVPMVRNGRVTLVARTAIACLAVASRLASMVEGANTGDDALPVERQRATVALRSGAVIAGELRWVSESGRKRTTDYLNSSAPFLVVHEGGRASGETKTHFVVKAHIATVTET